MAKKELELDPLAKTEEKELTDEQKKINPRGVGLQEHEWQTIEKIAGKNGVTIHAQAVWFMRYALKEYMEGRVEIPIERETVIKLRKP